MINVARDSVLSNRSRPSPGKLDSFAINVYLRRLREALTAIQLGTQSSTIAGPTSPARAPRRTMTGFAAPARCMAVTFASYSPPSSSPPPSFAPSLPPTRCASLVRRARDLGLARATTAAPRAPPPPPRPDDDDHNRATAIRSRVIATTTTAANTDRNHDGRRPPRVILDVEGMKCGGCSAAVQRLLEKDARVGSAAVNLLTGVAAVTLTVGGDGGGSTGPGSGSEADADGAAARNLNATATDLAATVARAGFPATARPALAAADAAASGLDPGFDPAALAARRAQEVERATRDVVQAWALAAVCCAHHAGHVLHFLGETASRSFPLRLSPHLSVSLSLAPLCSPSLSPLVLPSPQPRRPLARPLSPSCRLLQPRRRRRRGNPRPGGSREAPAD